MLQSVVNILNLTLCQINVLCYQILEQATSRLELTKPARRLYAPDGFVVLDIDDLVEWVQAEYVGRMRKQLKAEARARKAAKAAAADKGKRKGEEETGGSRRW